MACVVVVMAILSDSTPDRKRERGWKIRGLLFIFLNRGWKIRGWKIRGWKIRGLLFLVDRGSHIIIPWYNSLLVCFLGPKPWSNFLLSKKNLGPTSTV